VPCALADEAPRRAVQDEDKRALGEDTSLNATQINNCESCRIARTHMRAQRHCVVRRIAVLTWRMCAC
jgi:hypothetical protein